MLLLTQEEFDNAIPREAIQPFLEATQDYYAKKNDHMINCLQDADLYSARFMDQNPIASAIKRHRREWTEQPPKAEDFIPK